VPTVVASEAAAVPSPAKRVLTVAPTDSGMRFDRWLRAQLTHEAAQAHLTGAGAIDRLCRARRIRLLQQQDEAVAPVVEDSASAEAASATPQRARLSGSYRVQQGDRIQIPTWLLAVPRSANGDAAARAVQQPQPPQPQRLPLSASAIADLRRKVLHDNAQLLVLNKPAGLACHAGTGHREKHLDAMLWALESEQQEAAQSQSQSQSALRMVHRLDKETSGCLLLAKGRHVADVLSALLSKPASAGSLSTPSHSPVPGASGAQLPVYSPAVWDVPADSSSAPFVQKRYLALVFGRPPQDAGAMLSPAENGSLCHSSYRVLASSRQGQLSCTLLELQPHTGRKRQLREHCHMQLGCTIVGEQLRMLGVSERAAASSAHRRAEQDASIRSLLGWSADSTRPLPLCLHAHEILLRHPLLHGGEMLHVRAPLPAPFAKLCRTLFDWPPRGAAEVQPRVAEANGESAAQSAPR